MSDTVSGPWFDGHFPGDPVLPGIAQLHAWVIPALRRQLPALGDPTGLQRVRFRQALRPGDAIAVVLGEPRRGKVRFEVLSGDRLCTSGVLVFNG